MRYNNKHTRSTRRGISFVKENPGDDNSADDQGNSSIYYDFYNERGRKMKKLLAILIVISMLYGTGCSKKLTNPVAEQVDYQSIRETEIEETKKALKDLSRVHSNSYWLKNSLKSECFLCEDNDNYLCCFFDVLAGSTKNDGISPMGITNGWRFVWDDGKTSLTLYNFHNFDYVENNPNDSTFLTFDEVIGPSYGSETRGYGYARSSSKLMRENYYGNAGNFRNRRIIDTYHISSINAEDLSLSIELSSFKLTEELRVDYTINDAEDLYYSEYFILNLCYDSSDKKFKLKYGGNFFIYFNGGDGMVVDEPIYHLDYSTTTIKEYYGREDLREFIGEIFFEATEHTTQVLILEDF